MTTKQKQKIAEEIAQCEKARIDPSSSQEEKNRAENRIMQLTNQITSLKDGINSLLEIDAMIQKLMK